MIAVKTIDGREIVECNLRDFTRSLVKSGRRHPFSADVVGTLKSISRSLMNDRTLPPAFNALGYWLRPAAIDSYKKAFHSSVPGNCVGVPRGLAFHLPPTNVDTIFVYSWALSLLVGNANVVRLPSNANPLLSQLVEIISDALNEYGLNVSNSFVYYPHESSITGIISLDSDVRVIWGGDEKVVSIQRLPLPPGGINIPFPDRFSYSVINVKAYSTASVAERDGLASKAYNDIYLFDQMACSSSKIIFWDTEGETNWIDIARDYAGRCSRVAIRKSYELSASVRMQKVLHANQLAIDEKLISADLSDPALTSVYFAEHLGVPRTSQGGGLLKNVPIQSLNEISDFVEKRDQTLTYFGYDVSELREFASMMNGCGIDRIVPIGEALQFDKIWDGFDLLRSFSKLVSVK